jgi:hypothetical protein
MRARPWDLEAHNISQKGNGIVAMLEDETDMLALSKNS